MEKRHLDRRLAQMEAEGVMFRTGVEVGVDLPLAELRRRHDVILLTIGATSARGLPVPGADLPGVHQAMEYLPLANQVVEGTLPETPIHAAGKHVVIIGGGDTGADCLGTAHRQGAASITQLEILPTPPATRPDAAPWPTYPMVYRVTSAHEEGGERVYSVSTKEFRADASGRLRALLLVDVEMVDGRFVEVEGSERELAADLAFLAMGFTGPEQGPLVEQLGVALDERGNIRRDQQYATSVPGVFVAGDAGRGQSLIVWAIAEGRAAAAAVDAHLMGSTTLPAPIPPTARPLVV
jgi:glutamate synthase (NADPH/NADH) small chain